MSRFRGCVLPLESFLVELREVGRVRVDGAEEPTAEDMQGAAAILADMDADGRLRLAFAPPPLVLEAAVWAAVLVYRGCQFLVFRDTSAEAVRETLARPCPASPSPGVSYSADLTFQHLPELLAMARGAASGDPLTLALTALAGAWPLSSVGVEGLAGVKIDAFIEDRCLRRLYVDRILARCDRSRLADGRVREAVREALGLFPQLCPDIAAALQEEAAP